MNPLLPESMLNVLHEILAELKAIRIALTKPHITIGQPVVIGEKTPPLALRHRETRPDPSPAITTHVPDLKP